MDVRSDCCGARMCEDRKICYDCKEHCEAIEQEDQETNEQSTMNNKKDSDVSNQ